MDRNEVRESSVLQEYDARTCLLIEMQQPTLQMQSRRFSIIFTKPQVIGNGEVTDPAV